MGFERTIPTDDPVRVERDNVVSRQPTAQVDATRKGPDTTCGETNIFRQARKMRDEWRRQRYSRLSAG